ncbi:[citrate (pro-3S)-lyase] ligase [Lentilactobacillus sp. SPB1-3]|uniref:[citrate (Pro-3S)-lyase] ligase n=1 Tax=Lentilactobacillus terminaliae TaxID=3003483 RepID=A0ACD5DFU8_9LACO|nr:[citrate (pro-3S)-lyase] ligase [Lentilactobacillus sp. SPB1-3]MCZ0976686.1 [citrate (pro-3S)-lyase] ligase [Lentilactobacillus sp. SPB1-3]
MDSDVKELHLNNSADYKKWRTFLESLDITNFEESEVFQIDLTLGIYSGDDLVATGSLAGDTLKYIGVCNKDVVSGSRFNTIVSELVNREFQRGIFHMFVFTKEKYSESFQHVGFKELAHTDAAAVLENGRPGIKEYLQSIPRVADQEKKHVGAIVMNANPFTNGHRELVKQASGTCDLVYVFVVKTDASLFSSSERFELVKAGTKDLDNVIVVSGGDYMVSYLTFPAYFLKSSEETINYQTTIDARIFRNEIAEPLNISQRFVGTEPFSRTTGMYNQVLARELPPKVELKIMDRFEEDNTPVSATKVRKLISDDDIDSIADTVPQTTFDFIQQNKTELQSRIKRGMNINGN